MGRPERRTRSGSPRRRGMSVVRRIWARRVMLKMR